MRFLDDSQLHYSGQYGFRKWMGTVDAMYQFSKLMAKAINDSVCCRDNSDLSQAINCVNHSVHLDKLGI